MGVPSFFRWLSQKYPKIIVDVVEEEPKTVDEVQVPVDTSGPNPNNFEFDNLYLDMNGIIHPCSHPEDRPAPKSEEEIMTAIMDYIDRLFAMVRPRKLLYMAIDGVAPRAKMNQQRSRRFRAAQEAREKALLEEEMRKEKEALGEPVDPKSANPFKFDSNCITPGTAFMHKVSQALEYYIVDRTNTDPGWRGIKVILSDANVPGEGEHKIMEFIRRQRLQADYDANLKHVIYGLDADLIMLTLATHEPHFSILRELVTFGNANNCYNCGQPGHLAINCQGKAKQKEGEHDELTAVKKPFQFLHIFVLREYLALDLKPATPPPFEWEFERAVDDFVLLCFFVGNDFLPHLPTLEIREGAIELLMNLYSRTLPRLDGYLTHNGDVNLERVEVLVLEIGGLENTILEQRRAKMLREEARRAREKGSRNRQGDEVKAMFATIGVNDAVGVDIPPLSRGGSGGGGSNRRLPTPRPTPPKSNHEAADLYRAALLRESLPADPVPSKSSSTPDLNRSQSEGEEDDDEVKLGELGWKERYYRAKFQIETDADRERFCQEISKKYAEGLCWVMRYYYQGCCSWRWYYPYHYAPFSGDMIGIGKLKLQFELGTPFKPIEQLMCVLPTASKQFLPLACQKLMEDSESVLVKYYPTEFKIDKNGKKMAWQGVALLPFIDEAEFFAAVTHVEATLTEEEQMRNRAGDELLFVNAVNRLNSFLQNNLYRFDDYERRTIQLDPESSQKLFGKIRGKEHMMRWWRNTYPSPLTTRPPVAQNHTLLVYYFNPQVAEGTVFLAGLLPGAEVPPAVLQDSDRRERPPTVHDNDAVSRLVRRSLGEGGHGPMREREGPAARFHPYNHERGGRTGPRVDDRFNNRQGYEDREDRRDERHQDSRDGRDDRDSRDNRRDDRGDVYQGGDRGDGNQGGDRGDYRGGRGGYQGGRGGYRGGGDRGGYRGGGGDRGFQGRGGGGYRGGRGGGGGGGYRGGHGGYGPSAQPPPGMGVSFPPPPYPPTGGAPALPPAPQDAARFLQQLLRPEQLQALLPVAQLQQLAQQQQQQLAQQQPQQQQPPAQQFQQFVPPPEYQAPGFAQQHAQQQSSPRQAPTDPRMKRPKH